MSTFHQNMYSYSTAPIEHVSQPLISHHPYASYDQSQPLQPSSSHISENQPLQNVLYTSLETPLGHQQEEGYQQARQYDSESPPRYSETGKYTQALAIDDASENSDGATEEEENELIDEALLWTARATRLDSATACQSLLQPIAIPQDMPKLVAPFFRAWAPILESHDVNMVEFMEFMDHLNVVKAASPPLQVLNMAGTAIGFVPHHWFQLAGLLTNVTVGAATYAVARVRIGRYLQRANKEYFLPRGLRARVVKDKALSAVIEASENASQLSAYTEESPVVRDRRLQSLEGYIAPLQFENLPPMSQETNKLDQTASKMLKRQQERADSKAAKKAVKERRKVEKDNGKEDRKLDKEKAKLEREMEKLNRKTEKELRKKPEEAVKIEKKKAKEIRKIKEDMGKASKEHAKKHGDAKEEKSAKKFMWVVIDSADAEMTE